MQAVRVAGCVALSLVLVACSSGAGARPDDLQNPLSLSYTGSGAISINKPSETFEGEAWSGTFGSFLPCVAQGDGPIEITGMEWSSEPGPEPTSVAVYVRTFDGDTDSPIGSMRGTPEEPTRKGDFAALRTREGVDGLVVDVPCHDELGFDGVATEILVSMTVGDRGGHIHDITFTYETADGAERAVRNGWDFYLCGSEVPEDLHCG